MSSGIHKLVARFFSRKSPGGAAAPTVKNVPLLNSAARRRVQELLASRFRSLEAIATPPQWPAPNTANIRDRNPVSGLVGRHPGDVVYILGAGPQLNELSKEHVEELSKSVVIGVNRTFLAAKIDYFLSSYPWEVSLASRATDATLIHLGKERRDEGFLSGVIPVRRTPYTPLIGLPTEFPPDDPVLVTYRNIALAALHLSVLFGAKEVRLIGVEQENQLHFWQESEQHKLWLSSELEQLIQDPEVDHFIGYDREAMILRLREQLSMDPATLTRSAFHEDHVNTFRAYFDVMKDQGIRITCARENSIVARAGANVISMDSMFQSWQ